MIDELNQQPRSNIHAKPRAALLNVTLKVSRKKDTEPYSRRNEAKRQQSTKSKSKEKERENNKVKSKSHDKRYHIR